MLLRNPAGVSAFAQGGNEGQLYAALLVNGVQLLSNLICITFVDKARHPSFHCLLKAGLITV